MKSKEIWRATFYSDRTRDSGFKVNENKFRLDNRKKFFTVRVEGHWSRFPVEAVDVPLLELFKDS